MNVSPPAPKHTPGEAPSGIPPEHGASFPPHQVEPPPTRASELAAYGLLLGIVMIAIAAVWRIGFGDDTLATWFPTNGWLLNLLLGAALGPVFSVAAWLVFRQVPSFQHIKTLILRTIDMRTLAPHHAVLFGLLAGIPEEILFRGALQPAIGWLLTSLLFGALHGVTPAYFAYATLASVLPVGWQSGPAGCERRRHTTNRYQYVLLLMRTWRRRQRRAQRERERIQNLLQAGPRRLNACFQRFNHPLEEVQLQGDVRLSGQVRLPDGDHLKVWEKAFIVDVPQHLRLVDVDEH